MNDREIKQYHWNKLRPLINNYLGNEIEKENLNNPIFTVAELAEVTGHLIAVDELIQNKLYGGSK